MSYNINDTLTDLSVSPKMKDDLRTISTWARILSITNLVGAGISLLASLMAGSFLGAFLSAAITVLLNIYLLNFGRKMKIALEATDQNEFNDSLHDFQLYFKVSGILLIIAMSLVVIALLIFGSAIFSRL